MSELRTLIRVLGQQAGHQSGTMYKTKESPACRRDQTRLPAWDVWAKAPSAKRGTHVFTVVLFPNERGEFYLPNVEEA